MNNSNSNNDGKVKLDYTVERLNELKEDVNKLGERLRNLEQNGCAIGKSHEKEIGNMEKAIRELVQTQKDLTKTVYRGVGANAIITTILIGLLWFLLRFISIGG